MSIRLRYLLRYAIIALASCTFYPAVGSVIAGGEMTYRYLGDSLSYNLYQVNLTIYEDCNNGQPAAIAQDNPAFLAVYKAALPYDLVRADSAFYTVSDTMPLVTTNGCLAGVRLCLIRKTFVFHYALASSAAGYIIDYQRCCRNDVVINIMDPGNTGATYSCYIPPSATTNNSAVFTNYPPLIVALDTPLMYDCSATDADGDSLSYGYATPMTSSSIDVKPWPPNPPPFDTVSYITGYNSQNPISGLPPIHIDPVTGLMTGTPHHIGRYLVAEACNEWRAGVLINTVTREFEIIVADCALSVPNLSVTDLEIYPNPVNTRLFITAPNTISQVSITNLVGQVVYTHIYNTEKVQLDVATLPAGVYFVKINGTEVKKFVKE